MFGADASHESAGRGNQIRQILSVVLALNLTVAGAKLDYGFVSGSVAMSADGFHSLLDGFRKVVGPETQASCTSNRQNRPIRGQTRFSAMTSS